MVDPSELRSAIDQLAIRNLQAAYGDAVTRRAWDELVPMFLPDCPIRLDLRDGRVIEKTGPQEIGAFIASSIERFEFFGAALGNAATRVDTISRNAPRSEGRGVDGMPSRYSR